MSPPDQLPLDQQPTDLAEPAGRWSRRALVQSLLVGGGLAGLGLAALQARGPVGEGPHRASGPQLAAAPPRQELPLPPAATPAEEAPAAAPLGPSLSEAQLAAIAAIQQQILPAADGCPGAAEVGAAAYLQGALADPRTSPDDITSVIDGLAELDRLSLERHNLTVQAITPAQLHALLSERQADDDGAQWLGVMIVFALEALLGDPVYGGNLGSRGWQWLGLNAAEPRPSQRWYQGRPG